MKKTILVAEDEPHILQLVKLTLDDSFSIIEAVDGEEALNKIKTDKPDLVLLDIMMPKMNGYEVCKLVKSDSKLKDVIIAMLSAKGQEREILQGLGIGADYYFTKPFDPMRLKETIKQIVNRRRN